jgi:hypothetical protein
MPDYDFKRLSHVDFEELVHDLLESEWVCRLEAFKTGRDDGIDLRYIACDGARTIVQCKHYPNSSVSTLISKMKNEELPKIEALAPERYVLVTSAGLTPANKKALAEALHPFVVREDDIIGATEVEALLRANDAVVKTHYKLWLTSTAVMERVLHAAEHARTDIHLDKILRKLPLFVRHEAFPRALSALDDHRIVVISGGPGIGKSTLADMLLYSHVEGGFTPAVITDNLAEAHVLTRPGKKMLFYFDDFLGETYLGDRPDYLGRREDKALIDFVDFIVNSDEHRFILTTREHIFLGALEQSERLRHSGIAEQKCLIELSDYPRAHRARMLYNHLYFSQLPDAYKAAILEDDFFLEIIEHENFNPRVIEWLSTFSRLKTVAVEDYAGHVIKVLDDPHEIWRHAFEQEISPAARNVMIVLHSLGGAVDIEDLQQVWAVFDAHCIAKYRYSSRPGAFRSALKELEGAFLTYSRDQAHFLNPSVRDFMAGVFAKSDETVLDVISTAIRFRQLAELWTAARDTDKYPGLRQLLDRHAEVIEDKYRILAANNTFRTTRRNGRSATRYTDLAWWVRIEHLIERADVLRTESAALLVSSAVQAALANEDHIFGGITLYPGIFRAMHRADWLKGCGGWKMLTPLNRPLVAALPDTKAKDALTLLDAISDGVKFTPATRKAIEKALAPKFEDCFDEERWACSTTDEMVALKEVFERFESKHNHNFTWEINELEEAIAEAEANDPPAPANEEALTIARSDVGDVEIDDEAIRNLFGTLIETRD